jgi:hypothetical protein
VFDVTSVNLMKRYSEGWAQLHSQRASVHTRVLSLWTGFGFVTQFIDHLIHSQLVNTLYMSPKHIQASVLCLQNLY